MLTPPPVQTTYTQYINVGQNGMIASATGWDIDTRIAEAVTTGATGIPFGIVVTQSLLTDRGAVIGALSGGVPVGITAADPTLPNVVPGFTDLYNEGDNMAVLVRGDIWVITGDNVTAGSEVYFNSVTGQLGASGISNATALLGARWMTSVPSDDSRLTVETGNLAVCRIIGLATF
jgi:hypothetical protein